MVPLFVNVTSLGMVNFPPSCIFKVSVYVKSLFTIYVCPERIVVVIFVRITLNVPVPLIVPPISVFVCTELIVPSLYILAYSLYIMAYSLLLITAFSMLYIMAPSMFNILAALFTIVPLFSIVP